MRDPLSNLWVEDAEVLDESNRLKPSNTLPPVLKVESELELAAEAMPFSLVMEGVASADPDCKRMLEWDDAT